MTPHTVAAMPTSVAQLHQWLLEPEGQRLEFKEAKQRYDFEKLLKYCVALANEGGGTMVLGVTDKRPRRIVGTQAFEDPGRTEAGLHQRLGHRIPVEEMRLPEGRVLVVHVPSRLPGTAWNVDGSYFKRAGDDLAPLADHELRAMFAEGGPDFSGSSRDLGEVVVDGSEVGRLAVAKQTDPLPLPRHARCYVGRGLLGRPPRRFMPGASRRFAASHPL